MEAIKKTIAGLKEAIQSAKEKQKVAKEECKKLEKDMDEFKNNKEGKIDELKVCSFFSTMFVFKAIPCFIGRHLETESGTPETRCCRQDATKRITNSYCRAR
jgi:hypothetical protein